ALTNQQAPTYEVVLLSGARDCDGVRFDVPEGGKVLAEFQANQDEGIADGRVLTTFPRDNQRDGARETDYFVVFDRPVEVASVTTANLALRSAAGATVAGERSAPIVGLQGADTRILRFRPSAVLAASTRYELVVDDTITFGQDGTLDFRGRTPYAVFDTVAPRAPTAVTVRNAAVGFADKINLGNFAALVLDVTTPADAVAGDKVVARIYGGDAATTPTNDIDFEERVVEVPANGVQTIGVDFTGKLGTLTKRRFDDGEARFAVQLRRGSEQSGFAHNADGSSPRFDLTAPTVTSVGASVAGETTFVTDQERPAFFGVASEQLAAADLTIGSTAATMFASSGDGRFLMRPILVGRAQSALSYSLLVTDMAGNLAVAPATGNVVQRGVVTGALAGTLTVEAYDDATLQPIAGATVLVDPGVPTVPASGQLVGTTDAAGRASFAVGSASHTVTVVRAGYDLVTFYDTAAAHVSLPLRPLTGATATLNGSVTFQQAAGRRALIGSSVIDDERVLAIETASSTPGTIPDSAIRPSRPQFLTAFAGALEPTATPSVEQLGYQMLGATLLVPAPAAAPAAPGTVSRQLMTLVPSLGTTQTQTASHTLDFALANGLDTANLVGGRPIVRPTISLFGFGGQPLNGIGFATATTGAAYSITWDFGTAAALGFGAFTPLQWVATEARDTAGNLSRHRALFLNLLFNNYPAPSIPVVTAPGGPVTGAPAIDFADVLNRGLLSDAQAIASVTATDNAGRRWRIFRTDGDAVGGTETLQFPDLVTANVAGLAAGDWAVFADARIFWPIPGTTRHDFVLAEVRRQEVTYARSAPVTFTVQ
ncbi:MAG: hypothetical protein RL398_967, partial [Planctomycetota bacterium]